MTEIPEENAAAITKALFAGRKIEAIKIYRDSAGAGLKEAKEAMDRLEAELHEECPEKFSASAKGGCGAVLLFGGMLAALAGWGMA
ncbi:MAG: ribosomal protein L7/L12 [Candidatus Hydrogenedentes bacterium]|nr:ribosomal protein L7/L12 [Candidatus Hydrogenedentota bacterium]